MQVEYLGFGTFQWVILRGRIFRGDLEFFFVRGPIQGGPQFIQLLGGPNFQGGPNILGGTSDLLADEVLQPLKCNIFRDKTDESVCISDVLISKEVMQVCRHCDNTSEHLQNLKFYDPKGII